MKKKWLWIFTFLAIAGCSAREECCREENSEEEPQEHFSPQPGSG